MLVLEPLSFQGLKGPVPEAELLVRAGKLVQQLAAQVLECMLQ